MRARQHDTRCSKRRICWRAWWLDRPCRDSFSGCSARQRSARRHAGAPRSLARRRPVRARRGLANNAPLSGRIARSWPACCTTRASSLAIAPDYYFSEINLAAAAFINSLAQCLTLRRAAVHRLRLWRARVLPPATQRRHADVPLPPPRPRRSVLPARPAGHHRPRRFQRHRRGRHRRRTGAGGLHQPGAVPHQLRHHRAAGAHPGRRRRRAICRRSARCKS